MNPGRYSTWSRAAKAAHREKCRQTQQAYRDRTKAKPSPRGLLGPIAAAAMREAPASAPLSTPPCDLDRPLEWARPPADPDKRAAIAAIVRAQLTTCPASMPNRRASLEARLTQLEGTP